MLDEAAVDDLLEQDPDAAVALLADLAGATDERLRLLARQVAARVVVDLARVGGHGHRGVGRLVSRRWDRAEGDLDLDASLEGIVRARAASEPPTADALHVSSWHRPDTALCLVIDRSGSMEGERLAAGAVAAAAVATRCGSDCSVIAVAEHAIVVKGQGDDRPAELVVDDLLRLRGFGVTDLELGLRAAASQLERSGAARRLTLLLSDCRATTGPDPLDAACALDELAILAPAEDCADAEQLAAASGARLALVEGPSSVADALAALLDPSS